MHCSSKAYGSSGVEEDGEPELLRQITQRTSGLLTCGRPPVLLHNSANVGPMCYRNSAGNAMKTDAL